MTLNEIIESGKPYIGVRGYRLLYRAATLDNIVALAAIVNADSIGESAVTPS